MTKEEKIGKIQTIVEVKVKNKKINEEKEQSPESDYITDD